MNIIQNNDTYNNCKMFIRNKLDKLIEQNILLRYKRYDHSAYIYNVNVANPKVKSIIYDKELRMRDYIISNFYSLTKEQMQVYAHIYKVNIYIHYTIYDIFKRMSQTLMFSLCMIKQIVHNRV